MNEEIEYKYVRGIGWVAQYKTKYVTIKWKFKRLEGVTPTNEWFLWADAY